MPLLQQAGVPSPRLDAEVILARTLGTNRARLFAWPEQALTDVQSRVFAAHIDRRRRHEPVPYIIGEREFYGLAFGVDRRVLIPRPETELLVDKALVTARDWVSRGMAPVIVDVGTGSGCVAIAVARNCPEAHIIAIDISAEALVAAAQNAIRHGVRDRVHLTQCDMLAPVTAPVHVITANLPYVPSSTWSSLATDVRAYEPRLALDGGEDGLCHIEKLLSQTRGRVLPGGVLAVEIGHGQGQRVMELARMYWPDSSVQLHHDLAGLERLLEVRCLSLGEA